MTKLEHETALIRAFLVGHKKKRTLSLLQSPKGRKKICARLAHFPDLDPRFSHRIPSHQQSTEEIFEYLKSKGAPQNCYIISESSNLDGREMPLQEALSEIVGFGMGTLLSCIPGRLGYYEGEEPKERYILERGP